MKTTGDSYFDSKEFRSLLEAYEAGRDSGQTIFLDADDLTEVADYYHVTGNDAEAEIAISRALSLAPDAVSPLTYKMHEAAADGDLDLAWHYLESVADKSDPEYVYCRAELLLEEGKTQEADDYLRSQMASVPMEEMQDFICDVANIFNDYGQSSTAMEWMAKIRQEKSPEVKELLARTLFGLGKYDDSARIFNELLDHDPFSKNYWNALASAQFMNEDYGKAVESSEYAIAIDPEDGEGLISKANALYRLGNYEEAADYFRRYLAIFPDDEYALLHLATSMINTEKVQEALSVLDNALDVAPDDSPYVSDICIEKAFALSDLGRHDEALLMLDKAEKTYDDHVQLLLIRGHILLAADRFDDAQEQFRQAMMECEEPEKVVLRMCVSLYDNHFLETAYTVLSRYIDLFPENMQTESRAYLALCCHDLRRHDEFLNCLKYVSEHPAKECRMVLGHLFPDDVEPKDYYAYILQTMA